MAAVVAAVVTRIPSRLLLDDKDQLKFMKNSPQRGTHTYLRIWDPSHGLDAGTPTKACIQQDIKRICDGPKATLLKIWAKHVTALTKNNGRRGAAVGGWGGK